MGDDVVESYLTWVERVLDEIVRLQPNKRPPLGIDAIGAALGLDSDQTRRDLWEIVEDLAGMGFVQDYDGGLDLRVSQRGLMVRDGVRLTTAWPTILDEYLTSEQEQFLGKLVELSLQVRNERPVTEYVGTRDVFASLGWSTEDITPFYDLSRQVEQLTLAKTMGVTTGGNVPIRVTYVGVVRGTQQAHGEWQRTLPELVATWETTSVDFKRELSLKRIADKAEFVRDMLALATTQSSGRWLMIIGFDPKTHAFAQSLNPRLTADHLEDVLNEYVKPALQVQLHRVPWEGGEVGIVEAVREPAKVPYEVRRGLGPHAAGKRFVRHGTHVAAPDPEELESLLAEGRRARDGS